jgi:hypothetical protein
MYILIKFLNACLFRIFDVILAIFDDYVLNSFKDLKLTVIAMAIAKSTTPFLLLSSKLEFVEAKQCLELPSVFCFWLLRAP